MVISILYGLDDNHLADISPVLFYDEDPGPAGKLRL